METYLKVAAGVLIAAILGLSLGKDMTTLLTMAVCAMAIAVALDFARPVLDLIREMEQLAAIQDFSSGILLKVMAIGLISEIIAMICSDAGNASLGKALQFVSYFVILWLSIPLFHTLLSLIRQILGGT